MTVAGAVEPDTGGETDGRLWENSTALEASSVVTRGKRLAHRLLSALPMRRLFSTSIPRRSPRGYLATLFSLALLWPGCDDATVAGADASSPEKDGAGDTAADASVPLPPLFRDCVESACVEIEIAGDSPATLPGGAPSPSRGFADPSLRKDPSSERIWMAYSWPHREGMGDSAHVGVDNHLAHSDDAGKSWQFEGKMWTSTAAVDPVQGDDGFMNTETVSLFPVADEDGEVTWFSARLTYFSAGSPRISSFQLAVARADSPAALAEAPEQRLGGSFIADDWHVDTVLSDLHPDLAPCTFNDPGLLEQGGTLYLATQCQVFTPSGEDPEREFVALLSAPVELEGDIRELDWTYLGKLSDASDAAELGGENLLQTDLAFSRSGELLAIFSPSEPAAPLAIHFGCVAVAVESLDPPALARDADGALDVRAEVTATDLAEVGGPAACGYAPESETGIVIVRRSLTATELVVSLHESGLTP